MLAIMAAGMVAFGQCGDGSCGATVTTSNAVDTISHASVYAPAQFAPQMASRAQCIASCQKTFSDTHSAQYKACVRGCPVK